MACSSFIAGAAYAQTAAGDTVETVTVTGIIGSLGRAIEEKRSNSAIVDTVSAEDVGKFPDNNVAESLQRITGVEITRDANGEGQFATVRGLPTDFTLVTVNGMSASSIANGSATRTRSFDFSVISPDFISGLEVFKSGRADLDEGGIGANVDVKTVTPFGIGKERIVLSAKAQGEPGMYLNQTLPDLTALYNNTFANDTVGITAGVDWNQRFAPNESFAGTSFGTYCIGPAPWHACQYAYELSAGYRSECADLARYGERLSVVAVEAGRFHDADGRWALCGPAAKGDASHIH